MPCFDVAYCARQVPSLPYFWHAKQKRFYILNLLIKNISWVQQLSYRQKNWNLYLSKFCLSMDLRKKRQNNAQAYLQTIRLTELQLMVLIAFQDLSII